MTVKNIIDIEGSSFVDQIESLFANFNKPMPYKQCEIFQHGTIVIAWKLHIIVVLQASNYELFQSSIPGQLHIWLGK